MLKETVDVLTPLANSKVAQLIFPSVIASVIALVTYHFKSKEPLHGSVTWQWVHDYYGQLNEEPHLTVHNRSDMPAYIKRARILTGNFLKTEASRYAFSYVEPTDGNFPLKIEAKEATSFPLSTSLMEKCLKKAWWFNKVIGYVFKRNYLWLEVSTIGGARLVIPANDAAEFRNRPLWIERRWLPVKAAWEQ
ncbi:hypothetical protein [Novosphingobium sp. TCA1]|jgi:hypothetical protein|uniref:hypothetical protein n=1 Tax=Novosphingobium sp. TCA1 TaxID=2682474 RepID=UPI00135A5DD1|nr:hypothetical protein [Novosphingobium sp. TCA1]